MQSYVLGFGSDQTALTTLPGDGAVTVKTLSVAVDHAHRAGWTGRSGPAIIPDQWPRGPVTGLPMAHVITLELPEDYRRHGEEFVGISFFQGEGQFAEDVPADRAADPASDPFLAQLAQAVDHPQLQLRTDIIDGLFALLWLTREELDGPRCEPPQDVRRPGEHTGDEGPNPWDSNFVESDVWLVTRGDPNTGKVPEDDDWVDVHDDAYEEFYDATYGTCHLGGTTCCVQAVPDGLTPYYLELEGFGPLNFGGGNAQIDLESDTFDWACG